MRNIPSLRVMLTGMLAAVILCWAAPAYCAEDPLSKVDSKTVTVTQYSPDDKEVGKAAELTDGNDRSRWISHPAEKDLPMRLVFDMGDARTVGKVLVANYFTGQNFERGFKIVDVFIGDEMAPATGGTPAAADVELAMSDKTGVAWTEIALAKSVKGRYLTLRVKSNWGGNAYAANEVEIYQEKADAKDAGPMP